MIACYVGGKGMYATATTWDIKVAVIALLEQSALGYDTRFRYYRRQYPALTTADLARKVCDPIENYDCDWPQWRDAHAIDNDDPTQVLAEFFFTRDTQFRHEAEAAIFCLDEAGFGTGLNVMRFLQAGKPVLGLYGRDPGTRRVNYGNFVQLCLEYPNVMRLHAYVDATEIEGAVHDWLATLRGGRS